MSIHHLIPEKIVSKTPHAIAWLIQAAFAAALPEIYQKMPQHLLSVYLGFSPDNINRLKYFAPALLAVLSCDFKRAANQLLPATFYAEQEITCCPCN
jgi:hypothetical protein